MGSKWQKERDARVAEVQRRQTIYASYEWQKKMIDDIKAPLMEGIIKLLNPVCGAKEKLGALLKLRRAAQSLAGFPEPVKDNTWHPNSHRMIEIRDEFFKHCQLDEGRRRFIHLIIDFIIILYDYDPPYRMMIDWWAKQLDIKNWRYDVPVTVVKHDWSWWQE